MIFLDKIYLYKIILEENNSKSWNIHHTSCMDFINFTKICWYLDLKVGVEVIAIITFIYHFSPFIAFAYDASCGFLNDKNNDENDTHLLLWTAWLIPAFTGCLSAIFLIVAILLVNKRNFVFLYFRKENNWFPISYKCSAVISCTIFTSICHL